MSDKIFHREIQPNSLKAPKVSDTHPLWKSRMEGFCSELVAAALDISSFRLLLSPFLLQRWRFEPQKHCRLRLFFFFFFPSCSWLRVPGLNTLTPPSELYRNYNVALQRILENRDLLCAPGMLYNWCSCTGGSVISCIESKECVFPILSQFAHEIESTM